MHNASFVALLGLSAPAIPSGVLAGCGGDSTATTGSGETGAPTGDTQTGDTDTETNGGACGDFTYPDVTILGGVMTPGGDPAVGAQVWLEERNFDFEDTVYGTATTDEKGRFELLATQIVAPEGCWGTLVDYNLMATLNDASAEDEVNTVLFQAVAGGTFVADITTFPLQLEEPTTP
jgi:hypothetical protein